MGAEMTARETATVREFVSTVRSFALKGEV